MTTELNWRSKQLDGKTYDVVIIGAGMAGLTAAIYAKRARKSVIVLEKGAIGGQILQSKWIENWPGEDTVSGETLMKKVQAQAVHFRANFDYAEIAKIEKDGELFKISDEDGTWYKGKTVIIATGTKPREMSAKQTADAGERPISYCATCDGALYFGKPVVVVGHGDTAKYEIKYLEGICSKVYQIHHDDSIPEDAEAVFVAIGRVPYTDFLKGFVDLDTDGYVISGNCETSMPGVFVAGDCRTKNVRQLVTAAADGAVAVAEAIKYLE